MRSSFIVYGIISIIIGGIALTIVYESESPTFPAIEIGSFVGTIQGLPSKDGPKDVTLYIERFSDIETVLIVIFQEGWKPYTVQVAPAISKNIPAGTPIEKVPMRPIRLLHQGDVYKFAGLATEEGYQGSIAVNDSNRSTWKLQRISLEDFEKRRLIKEVFSKKQVERWLEVKADMRDVDAQFARGLEIEQNQKEIFAKLNEHLNNKDTLKEKAREKEAELRSKVEKAKVGRKANSKDISVLVRELEVLGRITERGKTVRLLRRLAKREQKWYDAHWGEGEDLAQVEAILGSELKLDFKKFKKDLRRANEVRSLQAQIEREKKLIAELDRTYKSKLANAARRRSEGSASQNKRSFWDKLF